MRTWGIIAAVFVCYSSHTLQKVYIIPPVGYLDKLFSVTEPWYNRDDCMRPFRLLRDKLLELGYQLIPTADGSAHDGIALITCGILRDTRKYKVRRNLEHYAHKKLIALLFEPPAIMPRDYQHDAVSELYTTIFTMLDTGIDNKRYCKLFYPLPEISSPQIVVPFGDKKLCVAITGAKNGLKHPRELYSERLKSIDFFTHRAFGQFDLYGHGWSRKKFPAYRGPIEKKSVVLSQYKYCICYENMRAPGYVTEKIFDCMMAGCVPIYWGADNITEYVSKDCFIDRNDFKNNEELYNYIITITPEQYNTYLAAITRYLNSEFAQKFSAHFFVQNLIAQLGLS